MGKTDNVTSAELRAIGERLYEQAALVKKMAVSEGVYGDEMQKFIASLRSQGDQMYRNAQILKDYFETAS